MIVASIALAAASAAGQRLSRWESMGTAARSATLIVAAAMLVLLGVLVWRQLRRRKIPPEDPVALHRWFRDYHYDWTTGTVANYTHVKQEETHVHAYAASGGSVALSRESIAITTTVYEEFTILFDGGWHDVSVKFTEDGRENMVFPAFSGREGHRMTAVWRRRSKGDERGTYVVFRDWTKAGNVDHPAASPHIHHSDAPIFSFVPVVVLGWIVGTSTGWLPGFDGISRNFLVALGFGLVWFAVQFIASTIDRGRSDEQLARALLVIGADDTAPQNPKAAP